MGVIIRHKSESALYIDSAIVSRFEQILPKSKALIIAQQAAKLEDDYVRNQWLEALFQTLCTKNKKYIKPVYEVKKYPVPIDTFITSPAYMDAPNSVYPKVMEALIELNSGKYVEAVLTGSIGAAKTTIALWTIAYQLYLLSCYANPHESFNLDPASEILFIFQSISASLSKAVDYARFRSMIEKAPYFNLVFPYAREIQSELRFPNRIIVKPISGEITGAIGQNVIGGLLDELNFMAVVENSKVADYGGVYNQAISNYNATSRRRKSRFMTQGILPGILCLVSSKRYPGQFTDVKIAEAAAELDRTGTTNIFVYDKCTWDIAPEGKFSGEWLWVFAGTDTQKPRILEAGEYELLPEEQRNLCKEVPVEYEVDFRNDIMNALRDIAGISTLASHPFFIDLELISKAFGKTKSIFSKEVSTLAPGDKLDLVLDNIRDRNSPRFVHLDLAVTGDSVGFVMGYVSKFASVSRGKEVEQLPYYVIDCALEIPAPKGGEILFYRIREILYAMKKAGIPIYWVTADSYQSRDTLQILRRQGFSTGIQSLDIGIEGYELLKAAFYDERIEIPVHAKLFTEIRGLEKNTKKEKIDHLAHGSKDIADALAGVVLGLARRREVWAYHNIPIKYMPYWLNKKKENIKSAEERGEPAKEKD